MEIVSLGCGRDVLLMAMTECSPRAPPPPPHGKRGGVRCPGESAGFVCISLGLVLGRLSG